MAQHKKRGEGWHRRVANPMLTAQRNAFGRLLEVHERTARKAIGGGEELGRMINLAEELGMRFSPKRFGPMLVRESLAAHGLGFGIRMDEMGFDEFANSAESGMREMLRPNREGKVYEALVIANLSSPGAQTERTVRTILGYKRLLEDYFIANRILEGMDTMTVRGGKDYKTLYMDEIERGEYPVPVLVARMLDIALNGMPNGLGERPIFELANTLYMVYYPLAETLGLKVDTVQTIRKLATETMLHSGDWEGIRKDKALYAECMEYCEETRAHAEWAQRLLVEGELGKGYVQGGLPRILTEISARGKIAYLASPTIDPSDVSRIKDAAGIYRKIRERRARGEDFGIGNLHDLVAATVVVEGDMKDAKTIAQLIAKTINRRQPLTTSDFEIDDKERPTGYNTPHLTFMWKVEMGGKSISVPVEIQVRTKEVHEKCRRVWSRGPKVSKNVGRSLVDALAIHMGALATSFSGSMARTSMPPEPISVQRRVSVRVHDESGKEKRDLGTQEIAVEKGALVLDVVRRIEYGKEGRSRKVGVSRKVVAKGLSLMNVAPDEMEVRIVNGDGPDIRMCKELLKQGFGEDTKEMLKNRIAGLRKKKKR